jgi:plasmid replication initiation protein
VGNSGKFYYEKMYVALSVLIFYYIFMVLFFTREVRDMQKVGFLAQENLLSAVSQKNDYVVSDEEKVLFDEVGVGKSDTISKKYISNQKKSDIQFCFDDNKIIRNELVFQHNNLVESKYRLSLQEKRLIIFLISQIKKEDNVFQEIEINIQELANIIETKSNTIYKDIKNVTKKIMSRILEIKDLDRAKTIQVSWIASAEYLEKKGTVILKLSEKLAPYLLLLQKNFTVSRVSDLMKFRSIYSIRIYELLKQYEIIGQRVFEIDELKRFCGIAENKLILFSNFKIKVLETAKKEINEKSDIFIDFVFIKKGRSFSSVKFIVGKNENYHGYAEEKLQKDEDQLGSRERLIESIELEFKLSKRVLLTLTENLSEHEISQAVKAVTIQMELGHVKNKKAILKAALKEKWRPDVFKVKK